MRDNVESADKILGLFFPVLDNGWVSLVDYCGGDQMIESFARTSYGKGTRKTSDTRSLIRYLILHHHTSPLECTEISFSISMPIHVARQLVRHRTFSPINEVSARYSVLPEICYEEYDLNIQSKNNKQGRSDSTLDDEISDKYQDEIRKSHRSSFDLYNRMLEDGVAREIARMHLPLNTYTKWFCKMDLNNAFKMLKLRLDSHAQYEIRQYANVMAGIVKAVCPLAFEAWYDYSFQAVNFTRLDRVLYQKMYEYKEKEELNIMMYENSWTKYEADTNIDKSNQSILKISKEIGMSSREFDEFWHKISVPEPQSFDLDLFAAKDALFFENKKL